MGLATSHDCWHGAYSAFARWRKRIAAAIGINLDSMEGFTGEGRSWSILGDDPIVVLLNHSDCDGEIAHEACGLLADRLEGLLPRLAGNEGGHVGDMQEKTKIFIKGLRLAASLQENVEFH